MPQRGHKEISIETSWPWMPIENDGTEWNYLVLIYQSLTREVETLTFSRHFKNQPLFPDTQEDSFLDLGPHAHLKMILVCQLENYFLGPVQYCIYFIFFQQPSFYFRLFRRVKSCLQLFWGTLACSMNYSAQKMTNASPIQFHSPFAFSRVRGSVADGN